MMKGFISKLVVALGCAAVLAGADAARAQCAACAGGAGGAAGGSCGVGCCCYRNAVDPCYPARYNYMARSEVNQAFAPQVQNGHVLDQTVWNYYFEPGSDRLNAGGLSQLAYLARRRPCPDLVVYLQTAQDIVYDPEHPEKLVNARQELDLKRAQALNNFLMAQTGGQRGQFQIYVHDPAEVGISAIPVSVSLRLLYYTRFRGGLRTNVGGQGGGGQGGGGLGGGGSSGIGIGGAGGPGGANVGGGGGGGGAGGGAGGMNR